ncbi:E3 ubiquitin-protein ligase E3D [Engraulis encrasicolus]|uniref:E3 ubiquitin-protein ligase E3D n=1 Tax=Engraulis encrasicolus TaxID=184585 RepID=UPI002FCF37BA
MDESGRRHEVFIELRQRLQSGLLIMRNDVAHSPTEVKVSSSSSSSSTESSLLIQTPRELRRVTLPPGVSVVPGSCQPTPSGDDGAGEEGLHFRLRLDVKQQAEWRGSVIERLQVQRSYGFLCQACGACIQEKRVFRRVLPLPSGNWNALVGDWCCHPDPFANLKLHPRPEDCLTGDTYFLLAGDDSSNQALTINPRAAPETTATNHSQDSDKPRPVHTGTSVVSCKKCSAMLGEALTRDVFKFYITEVVETEGDGITNDITRLEFVEKTVSARLVELSSAQSMFRFSLQTPSGKAAVLLWLLNTDTLVAWFPEKPVVSGGNGPLIPLGDGRGDEEHPSRHAVSAVKVLYLPCGATNAPSSHRELISAWEKDISVHPLTLPETTCQEVVQLLQTSTSCLPPSLRSMNSYQVAYMRR